MTAADAYAAMIAARGAPAGEHVFRRIYAGRELEHSRLVCDRGGFAHYESREPPVDVPDGARWLNATSENLDGGPGLANRIAVLDLAHPHAVERRSFDRSFDVLHPGPVPRFSRSATGATDPPPQAGQHSDELLRSFAFDAGEIAALRACGALAQ